jgi:hypothetical protein
MSEHIIDYLSSSRISIKQSKSDKKSSRQGSGYGPYWAGHPPLAFFCRKKIFFDNAFRVYF